MTLGSAGFGLAAALLLAAPASAAPPRPDHVVIVIEENHSFGQVINSPSAPYINQLASQGASCTSMFAVTHPSEPNYLELFSGSNQGITDDSEPTTVPWSTPSLGAALIGAGVSFAGYSQGLPAAGSLAWTSGAYARKHVPWTNWQASGGGTPPPNQLASTTNLPFSAFPADYSTLPAVSIVVPDLNNDMHDGTIAQADTWLSMNIGPYAAWAMMHNSLLIVTWDEDESASRDRIPTIFYGPMVRTGVVDSTWTLHNLARTIADMYGASAPGSTAQVRAMSGMWNGGLTDHIARFRQGASGYAGAMDTWIEQANPGAAHGSDVKGTVDGSPLSQGLIKFASVFGPSAGQVPAGATIVSAKLSILTGNVTNDSATTRVECHRMLTAWDANSTWTSMAGGVSADGVECAASAEFSVLPNTLDTWTVIDVTSTVAAWQASPDPNAANRGWALLPVGTDGWRYAMSESSAVADRPQLEVVYTVPCPADFDQSGGLEVADIFAFLNAWFAADPRCDFDGINGVQVQDIFAYLNCSAENTR